MKKSTRDPTKPRVYSYARFSTPEQKEGDSLRRQQSLAEAHAKKHGLAFDEQLRDEGLSGFSGKNRTHKDGQLGRFLKMVESGKVPSGSVLFVEEIDRLSRENMTDAISALISGLIKNGITLATPSGDYNRESVNNGGIWRLVAKLENAHDESRKKSQRLGAAWRQKKAVALATGKIFSNRCPAWLRVVGPKDDQRFEIIPEAAETVRSIFHWYGVEGLGRVVMERKLNREAKWMPPGRKSGRVMGWRASYIRKILENRSVLGELQAYRFDREKGKRVPDGEPRPNYYPSIVDDGLFAAAQKRIGKNKGTGGPTGVFWNVFQNFVECPYCAPTVARRSMVYMNRGPGSKGGRALCCDNWHRRACDSATRQPVCSAHSVAYPEFQETVLDNLASLRPEIVLPDDSERDAICRELRAVIYRDEAEQKELQSKIAAADDLIMKAAGNPERVARWEKTLDEMEARQRVLTEQVRANCEKLEAEEKNQTAFTAWQKNLAGLKVLIADEKASEARVRLNAHLKEFIARIEVFADGFPAELGEDETRPAPVLPAIDATKEERAAWRATVAKFMPVKDDFRAELGERLQEMDIRTRTMEKHRQHFVDDLMRRRLSRQGRFFRVHFKTGNAVDVVPTDSLASGMRLIGEGEKREWRFVRPDVGDLARRYKYRSPAEANGVRKIDARRLAV